MPVLTLSSLSEINPADWDALLAGAQPFVQHAFLASLEDSGSVGRGTGWGPAHRLLRSASGELLAAMPAYVKQHSYGEYVFDHAWAQACQRAGIGYYPKLLAAIPFTPVSGQRLLGQPQDAALLLDEVVAGLPAQGLSSLHVNFTGAPEDALLQGRAGWLQRLDCQYHWNNRGYRDFQDFLDLLSSRKRKQLRKEREQLAGQGISFAWHAGHELSEAQWDFVYACYANTYQVRGQAPYLTRLFFSLLAQRLPGLLRVVIASQAGKPLAMAFSLLAGDSLYGRYWGCLRECPGLHFETCFYQGMEYAIAQQLQRFDAGAQGEHKLVRGFEPVLTHSWHYLCHPGLRTAVANFLEDERLAVMAYAEQARALLPYRQA
ncbi:GNAT family N-acetyltransferase [Pseudomonas sp. N040]|uniref:GNAT family N-acetyltransferase n=1 Tax=Pseudomonas sp. N040 TaxID=2785325 RepID=UPI0018A25B79|nr:GNAT family N-acetyltransferase [Pseudomonas sp. N040]MBF7729677.1 N-acetyltransferase [Pseudomonas sp. N040]MBW7013319.1 GNAT family N-acetyltransferase [Pseudomonas sp. N040]